MVAKILSGVFFVRSHGITEERLNVEGGGGCLMGWRHRVRKGG